MKIALFGASGRTGQPLTRLALEKGHTVKALVRTPEKMKTAGEELQLIQGDSYAGIETVKQTVEGSDAVVSVLGHTKHSPDNLLKRSMLNITESMRASGVKRIILLTGAGVRFPEDRPKFMDKFIRFLLKLTAGRVLQDSLDAAEIVKQPDLEWTVVRAPRLTEKPGSGSYRVGYAGVGVGIQASRENLARFIIDELEQGNHIKDGPVVSDPE